MGEVSIDNKSYKFDELAKKYRDFYAPYYKVSVDGQDLVTNGVGITNLKVDTSVEKADAFSFEVCNAYDPVKKDFNWLDLYFSIGKSVEIKMGYTDKLETVFSGLITSVKFDFPTDNSPKVVVAGMDITFKMMKGVKSRSWINKKHSDVARIIAKEYGSKTEVDDTTVEYEIVEQSRATDYQFLSWLALENNHEFFIAGRTVYFRKAQKDKTAVVTLELGKNLRNLSMEIDVADQAVEVLVRGYDVKMKKEIEGKSKGVDKLGSGSNTGPDLLKKICGSDAKDYLYTNVSSKNEAEARATAVLNEQAMKLVSGSGESIGIPEIRAGKYIQLAGIGKRLSQVYYLLSVTHTMNDSGYFTAFTVGGNTI